MKGIIIQDAKPSVRLYVSPAQPDLASQASFSAGTVTLLYEHYMSTATMSIAIVRDAQALLEYQVANYE